MTRFRIVPERSTLWARATSSVHPITVDTSGLEGFVESRLVDGRPDLGVSPRGRVEIDVAKLKTGNPLYDGELERRLDVGRHPRIRGEVQDVRDLGDGRYRVRGALAFHGVSRDVEGDVRVVVADARTLEVEGEMTLDMRDFGLQPPRLLMLKVHPDVRVRGRVVAVTEE